jgi:pimeloyl-ACP methyl ester carboxylesterase
MVLHNARISAQACMLRRLLYIGLVLAARLATLSGRLAGQEPDSPGPMPMPTLGGKQFWADELFFHQWRIQRHVSTGHYRLLDEHDLRYASGTYHDCRAALEQIKRQQHLPRMSGKAVVVLHGLVRSRASMEPLCRFLREQGGYTIFNVEYPSTRDDIAEHARSLRHIIDHLDGIEEINFVAHSMGNIVVRHYLGDLARQEPWKQPPNSLAADRRAVTRFHRFVMLSPPNQGALLAEMFSNNVVFQQIMGDSGQQLGRDWPDLEKRLATPAFEFGIITGGKGSEKGYNPLLPGDNDGVISVETAKLAGARDFAVLPVLHSFVMDNDRVQEYVLRFLRHGHFVSEHERRPLEKSP